jgi:hypothetical protein
MCLLLVFECFGYSAAFAVESADTPSGVSAGASASGTSGSETTAGATVDQLPVGMDISPLWQSGSYRITVGGEYFLGTDVISTGTLYIDAPAGATVVLDFQGHGATVRGLVTAGIDLSGSEGTVLIKDSVGKDGNEPNLVVEANKVKGAVAGILLNVPEGRSATDAPALAVENLGIVVNLNTLDTDADAGTHDAYGIYLGYAFVEGGNWSLDVSLKAMRYTISINNIAITDQKAAELKADYGEKVLLPTDSGLASAVFTNSLGIRLSGSYASSLISAGVTADLYSTIAPAFILANDFTPANDQRVSVCGNGNISLKYVATLDDASPFSSGLVPTFTDATNNGFVCESDSTGIFFVEKSALDPTEPVAAGQSEDAGEVEPTGAEATTPALLPSLTTLGGLGATQEQDAAGGFQPLDAGAPFDLCSILTATVDPYVPTETVTAPTAARGLIIGNEQISYPAASGEAGTMVTVVTGTNDYYLSGNLSLPIYGIVITAGADADITLDLRGYTLESKGKTLTVNTARSVAIDGGGSGDLRGKLLFTPNPNSINIGGGITVANSYANTLALRNLIVNTTLPEAGEGLAGNGPGYGGLCLSVGTSGVTVDALNCDFVADASSRTKNILYTPSAASTLSTTYPEAVSFDSNTLTTGSFENCLFSTKLPTTAVGNNAGTYGIYINYVNLTLKGCTLDVNNQSAAAGGIWVNHYLASITFAKSSAGVGNTFRLQSAIAITDIGYRGQTSAAAISGFMTKITLNSPLSFDHSGAPFASQIFLDVPHAQDPETKGSLLAVGADFSTNQPLALSIGSSPSQNTVGYRFSTYIQGFEPDATTRAVLAAAFTSKTNDAVQVVADEQGLRFALNPANAVAAIVHGDDSPDTLYDTTITASAAVQPGDTIKLLRNSTLGFDIPAVGTEDDSITVDLNGHSAAYLVSVFAGTVRVQDGSGSATRGSFAGTGCPYAATAKLSDVTLTGVLNTYLYVNSTTGTLDVESIDIAGRGGAANGVVRAQGNGSQITLKDVAISFDASAACVLVYGNAGSILDIEDCTLQTTNTNIMTGTATGVTSASASITMRGTTVAVAKGTTNTGVSISGIAVSLGTLVMTDCSINATDGTTAYGANVGAYGRFDASWTAYDPDVVGIFAQATANVCGVFNNAASGSAYSSASLTNAKIQTSGGSNYRLGFVSATVSSSNYSYPTTFRDAQLNLDGLCSFDAPLLFKTPIGLTSSFATYGAVALSIGNPTTGVDGAVFAVAQDGTSDIGSLAQYFVASDSSIYYSGWAPVASVDNTKLLWNGTLVVTNTSLKTRLEADAGGSVDEKLYRYPSLSQALADAAADDTIRLDAAVSTSPVSIALPLTIDLNGKDLTVNAASSGTSGGIAYTGTGELTITDSGSAPDKGALVINTGATLGSAPLIGIAVDAPDGSLILDGCALTVNFAAHVSNNTLYGISNKAGVVSLKGDATLKVNANKLGTGEGVTNAYGVYLAGTADAVVCSLEAEGGTSIEVRNDTAGKEDGTVGNNNYSTDAGKTPSSLREINPAPDSSLYAEIQTKFRLVAKFDSPSDTSEQYYIPGAGFYYACPIVLDDGNFVYAYSKPVPSGQEGDLSLLVADKMYMQSTYTTMPQATGIGGAAGNTGSVTVAGSVKASSATGDASAVYAVGSGAWRINGAQLYAVGGATTYWKRGDVFDLRSVFDFDFPRGINYIESRVSADVTQVHLVAESAPLAVGVNSDGNARVVLAGAVQIDTFGLSPCDIVLDTVYLNSIFSTAAALSVGNPAGANSSGVVFAQSSTDSVLLDASMAHYFVDVDGALAATRTVNGALAWDDLFRVSFYSGFELVQGYTGLQQGETVVVPNGGSVKKDDTRYEHFEFLGWSKSKPRADAGELDLAQGDIPAVQSTVNATGNDVWYAVFKVVPNTATVAFTGIVDSAGNPAGDGTTDTVVFSQKAGYGQTMGEFLDADNLPVTAAEYTKNGARYVFVGWKTVSVTWDARDITSQLVFDEDIAGFTSGTVTFTANYVKVSAGTHLVRLKIDERIYAYAAMIGTAPSLLLAGTPATITKATENGHVYTFKGWYGGWTAQLTATPSYSNTLLLPPVSEDVIYTACFDDTWQTSNVSFTYWYANAGAATLYQEQLKTLRYNDDPWFVPPETDVVKDGVFYHFTGWSTRKSDKEPLYTTPDTMPRVLNTADLFSTSSAKYYGVYTAEPQTATVTFMVGDDAYTTVSGVGLDGSQQFGVSDAFLATGAAAPGPLADGQVFQNAWNTSRDASTGVSRVTVVGSTPVIEVTLYAVYGAPQTKWAVFYETDDLDNEVTRFEVVTDQLLGSIGALPAAPRINGSYLKGWTMDNLVDGTGNQLPVDPKAQKVDRNLSLYPLYETIGTDVATAGASMDASGMDVGINAYSVDSLIVKLAGRTAADGNIAVAADADGKDVIGSFAFGVEATRAGAVSSFNDGFGTVTLSLPVSSTYAGKDITAYYLKSDGSVGSVSVGQAVNGLVTLAVSDYADSLFGGNIALTVTPAASSGVDKTGLAGMLTGARSNISSVAASADGKDIPIGTKWVPNEDKAAYQAKIDAAQAVFDDPDATAAEVYNASESLQDALVAFSTAQAAGTYTSGGTGTSGLTSSGTSGTSGATGLSSSGTSATGSGLASSDESDSSLVDSSEEAGLGSSGLGLTGAAADDSLDAGAGVSLTGFVWQPDRSFFANLGGLAGVAGWWLWLFLIGAPLLLLALLTLGVLWLVRRRSQDYDDDEDFYGTDDEGSGGMPAPAPA